jgi:aspartyl-tRNA(Asn)/glutamyl-tRNA(Gln) amidotransferase subunit A
VSNEDAHPLDSGIRLLSQQLRDGSLTARELTRLAFERIEERNGGEADFDGRPDAINAWVRLDRDAAEAAADAADRRIAAGDPSLLAGIPVGLKDLFGVAGKPLTASSRLRAAETASADSAVWASLADAGAVYVGHTHTHEFAAGGTTDQVGNPWNLAHSPGGSSGGSGAAVAAGMVPLTVGTDTAGSLRIPAALVGVSSFKASYGRVPTDGVIPLSTTLDHAGPIARTIDDCAVALEVLSAAPRARDPFGVGSRPRIVAPQPADLHGVRVAITDRPDLVDVELDVRDGLEKAVAALWELGATVVTIPAAPDLAKADYDTIFLAEARAYHAQYADRADEYRPSVREFLAHDVPPMTVDVYLAAQQRRAAVTAAWQRWFADNDIAALIEPTAASTAPLRGHGYDAGRPMGGTDPLTAFTATWNVTGFPVAALPAGIGSRSGLPVGVSVVGPGEADSETIAIALALQERLPVSALAW